MTGNKRKLPCGVASLATVTWLCTYSKPTELNTSKEGKMVNVNCVSFSRKGRITKNCKKWNNSVRTYAGFCSRQVGFCLADTSLTLAEKISFSLFLFFVPPLPLHLSNFCLVCKPEIKPKALFMIGKSSTTEQQSSSVLSSCLFGVFVSLFVSFFFSFRNGYLLYSVTLPGLEPAVYNTLTWNSQRASASQALRLKVWAVTPGQSS